MYSQISNQQILSKRIICQIDSLMRLDLESYDIIIIDECESLSRYMTSSHFSKNIKSGLIVSALENYVIQSNKIILMDADLSDRSLNYYSKILNINDSNEIHLLINIFKSSQEYTLTTCNFSTWIRKIYLFLEDNKKIGLPIASNNQAKNIKENILRKYPNKRILLINVEMEQSDKEFFLYNVNKSWSNYDVVIYTPSVTIGVSYDIENYFDYIFCYGCYNSITSQEIFQMLHRIRSPVNKEIFISMCNNDYKVYDIENDVYTYDTIENMISQNNYLTEYELHTNILPKKYINKNITYQYKDEPIYDLYIRNCKEIIENRVNFTKEVYGYAKFKGYNLSYIETITSEDVEIEKEFNNLSKEKKIEDRNKLVDNILNTEVITKEDYNILSNKKNLTNNDFYKIEKYNFVKCYNVQSDKCNYDFIINEQIKNLN